MKSTKLFLWFLLLLAFSCFSILQAQNVGKIRGEVRDSETGEPLSGVNIVIKNTNMGAATNNNGHYVIVNVSPGEYTLSASIIGYATLNKTNVLVEPDHTTVIDFNLEESTIEGETITVTAERDVIKMDMSSSQKNATAEEIDNLPFSRDIHSFLDMQAGIDGWSIRGGGQGEVSFMVDGMAMNNSAFNRPMNMVNMSSISEVSVIKGGFNAEYGNIRSGVIEVSTKEGTQEYHGSASIHYSPPHKKHTGYKITHPKSWGNRVYLDPKVAFDGTAGVPYVSQYGDSSTYGEYFQNFQGWNKIAEDYPGLDGEDMRNIFIYQHGIDGYDEWNIPDAKEFRKDAGLSGEKADPRAYAVNPDRDVEFSLGGPVPFSRYLGNATFFASFRDNLSSYAFPSIRDYYHSQTGNFSLTSYLTSSTKLKLDYLFQIEQNIDGEAWGSLDGGGTENPYVYVDQPGKVNRSGFGATIEQSVSSRTYWQFKLSGSTMNINSDGAETYRTGSSEFSPGDTIAYYLHERGVVQAGDLTEQDTADVGYYPLTEAPWGFSRYPHRTHLLGTGAIVSGLGAAIRDNSETFSLQAEFDITSQVNRHHEIKAGLMFSYDHFDADFKWRSFDVTENRIEKFSGTPLRGAAYIQDKFEYKGLIANVGVRMEVYDPNTEWYKLDADSLRYSKYFSAAYKSQFDEEMPREEVDPKIVISPRIGVSHPITASSKIYFNYGHQYSTPGGFDKYNVNYTREGYPIDFIGNPRMDLPRTISYELGFDQQILGSYLISLSGYYKDVTNEIGSVFYEDITGSVAYSKNVNNAYSDIRGLEISLEKRWGKWITGALNYTYMVEKFGMVGRESYFEDPMRQRLEGYRNPIVEKPLPIPNVNGYLTFMTPERFGPDVAGIYPLSDWNITTSFYWSEGEYITWEPVGQIKRAQNNVQWRDEYNADMRISKRFTVDQYSAIIFADISNVFNIKRLVGGFKNETDYKAYMSSLRLEEYKKDKYDAYDQYKGGNDKPGDWKADYINLPNIDLGRFTMGRQITFGMEMEF